MTPPTGPILLGGLAGSGKTPMRRVLGAHPDIVMTRRTYLWTRFHGQLGDLSDPATLERCLGLLTADPHVRQLRPDPDRLRRDLATGPPTEARLFGLLHAHHAERLGARRWGDQLGGIERYADDALATWPDAHVLHMLRRPPPHDVAGMLRWQASRQLARRNRRHHPGRYHVIALERLVARPEQVLAEVCDVLGEAVLPPMRVVLADVHARLVATGEGGRATGAAPPVPGGAP